jgi:hypothetical protein
MMVKMILEAMRLRLHLRRLPLRLPQQPCVSQAQLRLPRPQNRASLRVLKFFPRELWQTLQPNFRPDTSLDGYQAQASVAGSSSSSSSPSSNAASSASASPSSSSSPAAVRFTGQMGGDYNAEQYFDDGEDDIGDEDGGGGGGDDEF